MTLRTNQIETKQVNVVNDSGVVDVALVRDGAAGTFKLYDPTASAQGILRVYSQAGISPNVQLEGATGVAVGADGSVRWSNANGNSNAAKDLSITRDAQGSLKIYDPSSVGAVNATLRVYNDANTEYGQLGFIGGSCWLTTSGNQNLVLGAGGSGVLSLRDPDVTTGTLYIRTSGGLMNGSGGRLGFTDGTDSKQSTEDLRLSRDAQGVLKIHDPSVTSPVDTEIRAYDSDESDYAFMRLFGGTIAQFGGSAANVALVQLFAVGASRFSVSANQATFAVRTAFGTGITAQTHIQGPTDETFYIGGGQTSRVCFVASSGIGTQTFAVARPGGEPRAVLPANGELHWTTTNNDTITAGADLSLARDAAAVLKIASGAASANTEVRVYDSTDAEYAAIGHNTSFGDVVSTSGLRLLVSSSTTTIQVSSAGDITCSGQILHGYRRWVEVNTAGSGAPHVLNTGNDSSRIFTNEGAVAENFVDLPSALVGLTYSFVVQDADGMRITANVADTIRIGTDVSAAAGYISSTEVGASITIAAINGAEWVATDVVGTWTVDGVAASSPLVVSDLILDDGAGNISYFSQSNQDGRASFGTTAGGTNGQLLLGSIQMPGSQTIDIREAGGYLAIADAGFNVAMGIRLANAAQSDFVYMRYGGTDTLAIDADGAGGNAELSCWRIYQSELHSALTTNGVDMGSSYSLRWSSTGAYSGTKDIQLSRNGVGQIAVSNPAGTTGGSIAFFDSTGTNRVSLSSAVAGELTVWDSSSTGDASLRLVDNGGVTATFITFGGSAGLALVGSTNGGTDGTVRAATFDDNANTFALGSGGLSLRNTSDVQWSSDGTDFGAKDLALVRAAANYLAIENGAGSPSGTRLHVGFVRSKGVTAGDTVAASSDFAAVGFYGADIRMTEDTPLYWTSGLNLPGTPDVELSRDAASILALKDPSSTNDAAFRTYDSGGTLYSSLNYANLNGPVGVSFSVASQSGTNLLLKGGNTTSMALGSANITVYKAIGFTTGIGAVDHIIGPTDQPFEIRPGTGQTLRLARADGVTSMEVLTGGVAQFSQGVAVIDDVEFRFGSNTGDCVLDWSTVQAGGHALVIAPSTNGTVDGSGNIIITDSANRAKDHDHAFSSNPTLFIHSATDPDTANDEWISLAHDGSNGVLNIGSGVITSNATIRAAALQTTGFGVTATTTGISMLDNLVASFGSSVDMALDWSTAQVSGNAGVLGINTAGDATGSGNLIVTTMANVNKDHDHGFSSNPTLFIHSATDPDTANDEWIALYHNGTDGYIDVGSGAIVLGDGNHRTYFSNVGTAAAPGWALDSDQNTGMFWDVGGDQLAVSTGGTEAVRWNASQQTLAKVGDATSPSYTFSGDTNTGFFNAGADRIGVANNGVHTYEIGASVIKLGTRAIGWTSNQPFLQHDTTLLRDGQGILKLMDSASVPVDAEFRVYDSGNTDYAFMGVTNSGTIAAYGSTTLATRIESGGGTALTLQGGGTTGLNLNSARVEAFLPIVAEEGIRATACLPLAQQGAIEHDGTTTNRQWGLYASGVASATGSTSAGGDISGSYKTYTSGAVSGNEAGYRTVAGAIIGSRLRTVHKFAIDATTNVRVFVGQSNAVNLTTMTGADDPAEEYVGLQYSTDRADTNWTFVVDDGTTQTTHASTVAVGTAPVTLEIIWADAATSVDLHLYDRDGVLQDSHTFSTNLPTSTTIVYSHSSLETRTTAARAISVYRNAISVVGS